MHAILDVVEDMLRESCSKAEEWEKIMVQLYMPDPNDEKSAALYSAEATEDSFDSFFAASAGTKDRKAKPSGRAPASDAVFGGQ